MTISPAVVRRTLVVLAVALIVGVRLQPLSLAGAEQFGEDAALQFHHEGEDGQQHVYLGDFDSYLWVRHARNYLRHGTTCDAVVDGVCRDTFAPAPVGRRMQYARSLHIVAIVALHRLIGTVLTGYPLTATAFWVQVLIGALGAPPAFAIGRRLGGLAGGLGAALLVGVHPLFLDRSLGSDNDVWNVVLPLWMAWAAIEAVSARRPWRTVVYALLAAGFAAAHAGTWSGWVFGYGVVLGGLGGCLLLAGARLARAAGSARRARRAALGRAALALGVFFVAAGPLTTIAGSEERYLSLPGQLLRPLLGASTLRGAAPQEPTLFPDVFTTVAENKRPDLAVFVRQLGGWPYAAVAALGLLLCWLPGGRPPWRVRAPAAVVVTVWLLAALVLAQHSVRLVLLLVPPLGVAGASALGRVHVAATRLLVRRGGTRARLGRAAAWAGVVALLVVPLWRGTAVARAYVPFIHDAWWDTLVHLRDARPADVIIDTWWDFGHWVKYVAERRTSADGASLRTHAPYWLARALFAPSERETAGLLRMLNCGSDATPEPEGREGAYGKLRALGLDELAAHALVVKLASLGREAAREELLAHGLDRGGADAVLRSTHCVPPSAYLVLSTGMLQYKGMRRLGNWDLRRAYVARLARSRPPEEAVAELVQRLGMPEQEARSLDAEARTVADGPGLDDFIAPADRFFAPRWFPCRAMRNPVRWKCRVRQRLDATGATLRGLVYRADAPLASRFHVRGERGRAKLVPAAMVLAGPYVTDELVFPGPGAGRLAVLMNLGTRSMLLGPSYLVRSTFTRLLVLDGHGLELFRKVDDRQGPGERVLTWRIAHGE